MGCWLHHFHARTSFTFFFLGLCPLGSSPNPKERSFWYKIQQMESEQSLAAYDRTEAHWRKHSKWRMSPASVSRGLMLCPCQECSSERDTVLSCPKLRTFQIAECFPSSSSHLKYTFSRIILKCTIHVVSLLRRTRGT